MGRRHRRKRPRRPGRGPIPTTTRPFSTDQRLSPIPEEGRHSRLWRVAPSTSTRSSEAVEACRRAPRLHLPQGTAGTVDAWVAEIRRRPNDRGSAIFSKRTPWSSPEKADPRSGSRDPSDMLTLEWERGAVFRRRSTPGNRHNQTGKDPVRLVAITNAPLLIDTFRHTDSSSTTTTCSPSASTARKDYFSRRRRSSFPPCARP